MRRLAAVLAICALAACAAPASSTGIALEDVATTSGAATEGALGSQAAAAPGTGGAGGITPSGQSPAGAAGGDAGVAAGSAANPALQPGRPAGPGAAVGGGGTGPATDGEIRIGFQVSTGLATAFAGAGFENGGDPPNERDIVQALVAWANANGGVAGREIVPFIHETNITSGTFASQAAAACSTFTEDAKVFAAGSTPVGGIDALAACMADKRTPLLENNYFPFTQRQQQAWNGFIYQPGRMTAERGWESTVNGLVAADFFDGAKLGIVRFDDAHFRDISDRIVKPQLARHGIDVDQESAVSPVASYSDLGRLNAELNNIILRYRTEGITHILFVEFQGVMPFFFLSQAESQGYRPKYGLPSISNPSTVAKQSPAAQSRNVTGVGWNPSGDTLASNYPDNAAAALCYRIMKDAGVPMTYNASGYYALPHCDTVFFLREALADATSLTPETLRQAADRMGDRYLSPQGFATRFARGRADGAATWRLFRFDDDCGCFAYRGARRRAPQ